MGDKGRWIKIAGIATAIAVALAVGVSASRVFFQPGAEKLYHKAQATYAKGADALNGGDAATAAIRFEEANLQANLALDTVIKEKQATSQSDAATASNLTQLEGRMLWLKLLALRDLYVAKAAADGHPLPVALDSITGVQFHSLLAIPDDQARNEALACLREAARRLTDQAEVLRQALLTELMFPNLDWVAIERLSRQALQINSSDPWALYMLARFDFEQTNGGSRKSRSRVLQARDYVKQLKEAGNYPLWRTLFLQAQIAQWVRDNVTQGKQHDSAEETLRSLLSDPKGDLARAAAGEGLEHPGKSDIEGVYGLHQMALTLAVEDSRQPNAPSVRVLALLNATMNLCRQLGDKQPAHVGITALTAVQALTIAEPVLMNDPPSNWKQDLNLAQELIRKAQDQKVTTPVLYEVGAGLLSREAHLEAKRGNKDRQAELNKQALQWIEDGLRLGAAAQLPAEQLLGLNARAAEVLTITAAKPEQARVYLNVLKESKSPRARALAALLEASVAQRNGRLNQARKLLEQVVASDDSDLATRAHMVLGVIFLALGQPDKALLSLQQVAQAYKVYDRLTPQEKSWAVEFIHGPEDLALLQLKAHVESALMRLREQARRNPGKLVSLDNVRHHETAIAELRKKLQRDTPQDRQAHEIMVSYYSATKRRELADRELAELARTYSDGVDVLRTEINMIESTPDALGKPRRASEVMKEADERINRYIKGHPDDLDARFFKVEWLIRSKRLEDALTYLQAPTNFADTHSERYQRVLAAVLLTKGDRQASQKVLERLPHDAATDALLIQAASADDRDKLVRQALARYEDNALFQNWQAALALNKRDYAAAAEAFLRVSQYNRYETTGKRGLLQSFFALAQKDPVKARDLALRLRKEAEDEPTLLLAIAFADLYLDEIGMPNDPPSIPSVPGGTKGGSMAAVLNAWEQTVLEPQPLNRASLPVTKSVFWVLAGRQDLALAEAVRALGIDPRNPEALEQTISLALELREPAFRDVTRKRLDTLRQVQPNDSKPRLLEARFDEWIDQPNDALAIYEDLLAKDAKLSEAYSREISLLEKRGNNTKALRVVKRWRMEQPDNIAAAQAEVRLLAENKQAAEARRLAESVVRSHTEVGKEASDRIRRDLQLQMISGLAQGKAWSAAENWLEQLQSEEPDNVAILLQLGSVYLAQSSWDKARAIYEKVLAKDKSNVAAVNNLAWLLAKNYDNAAEALRLVQEARKGPFSHKPISGDRLRPEFLDTLGVVYTKMGTASLYPEMRDLFEAARQRYPNDPRVYMYLGHAYAGLLETERAERLYATAVQVARKSGRQFLSPEQCENVIAEVEAAQKKLKETAKLSG